MNDSEATGVGSLFEEGSFLFQEPRVDFDEPPAELAGTLVSEEESVPHFEERVRVLVTNAQLCEADSRRRACRCLCEAGRMSDLHLGRIQDAWRCYAKALAVDPDSASARSGLLRLSRRFDATGALRQVLEHTAESSDDPDRSIAALCELAVIHAREGRHEEALGSLRDASSAGASVALVDALILGIGSLAGDDAEVAEALSRLGEDPGGKGAGSAGLAAALFEERLGKSAKSEELLSRLDENSDLQGMIAWTRARLALGEGDWEKTATSLEALRSFLGLGDHEPTEKALGRISFAIRVLAQGLGAEDHEPSGRPWDLGLLSALADGDRRREAVFSDEGCRDVAGLGMKRALCSNRLFADPRSVGAGEEGLADLGETGFIGSSGMRNFLGVGVYDLGKALRGSTEPEERLFGAMWADDHPAGVSALEAMEPLAYEEEDRWGLKVARAALTRNALDDPAGAVEILENQDLSIAPLPSLLRMHRRDSATLAKLAVDEAKRATSQQDAAVLTAWAGVRLSPENADQGRHLLEQALEIDPACTLSLKAIDKGGADHKQMGSSLLYAAASTSGEEARKNTLGAASRFLAAGDLEKALEALCDAVAMDREDAVVFDAALRMARSKPESSKSEWLANTDVPSDGIAPLELGLLAFSWDKVKALRHFEAAMENGPDFVARMGAAESALYGGRPSVESGRLLAELREAEGPEHQARMYMRLAEVDERFGGDPAAGMLSLMSSREAAPDHLPVLARLAMYYAAQGRIDDWRDAMGCAAGSILDDSEAAAAAFLGWRRTMFDASLLEEAGRRRPQSVYTLAALDRNGNFANVENLTALTKLLPDTHIFTSRGADAQEAAGDYPRSAQSRREALALEPASWIDIFGLERLMGFVGDDAALLEAKLGCALATKLPERKIEKLLEAAATAREKLGDDARAAILCLDVLREDPANDEAFRRGREIIAARGDLSMLDRFISARVEGISDPAERWDLLLELARVRLDENHRKEAKEALSTALELKPSDLAVHRWKAELHAVDGEWPEAIAHLVEAARVATDPKEGEEIFFELGVAYMDHTERKDLAEKSFVKVLGWNRTHFHAMDRLADLYLEASNWHRGAQALEHVVRLADDEDTKIKRSVDLARCLEQGLGRPKDAERIMNELRREAPLDIRPVEYLAGMYTRQRDAMALNVLLDQSLSTHSNAVAKDPDNGRLYSNVLDILVMKGEDATASLASAAMRILGAGQTENSLSFQAEISWDLGARVADPSVGGLLCPSELPPGLRETLKALEEPLIKTFGLSAKQLGYGREARIDKRSPFGEEAAALARAFGMRSEPILYRGQVDGIKVIPGSTVSIVLPEAVVGVDDEDVIKFSVASALMTSALGVAVASLIPEDKLRTVLAAVVRLCAPDLAVRGVDPAQVNAQAQAISQVVSKKQIEHVQQFAFDCQSAVELGNLRDAILTMGYRAGFLSVGGLHGSVSALRALGGVPGGPLAAVPAMGTLLSFVFSKDHLELRRRLGI